MGTYSVQVDAIQTRLPVPKITYVDGVEHTRTMFIPMTKLVVVLTSTKGGSVRFQATSMGKKTTVSRLTDLPVEMMRNQTPYGESLVVKPGSGKAQPIKMTDAVSSIQRMTGASAKDAESLFNFESLLAGELEAV